MTVPAGATTSEANKIDAIAAALIEARTEGKPIDRLPDELLPADAVEAQLVDDRVAEVSGWEVLGWKIGCTSEHAQNVLGASGPMVGRVYSVVDSGSEIARNELMTEPSVEGELAVTLGREIAPGAALDRTGLIDAVSEVRPAIEVVGGRFTRFVGLPLPNLIADAGGNNHLVLGPAAVGFDPADLVSVAGSMTVDGTVTGQGTGADVLGDPIDALSWLVDHLGERGIALLADQVITTGTLTQLASFSAGSTAVAAFDGLGEVTVSRAR